MAGERNTVPVELPADEEIWPFRLAGEPQKAFRAFRAYRDLGPARSHRQVAAVVYGLDLETVSAANLAGKMRQVAEWSRLWAWVQRADEHDRQVDRLAQRGAAHQLMEMRTAHAAGAREMFERAMGRILATEMDDLSPHQTRLWLLTATQIERGARDDDPTVRVEHSGEIGSPVDQLREMLDAVATVGASAVWGDDEADQA